MKQSSLVDSCSYWRIIRFVFFLISFCIFVTPTHARVVHRRLWPWPSRPWPFPGYQPQPWPLEPPKPASPPGPSPCPPPKPQPTPPPAPSPSCPLTPPKPQPKPPPAPSPSCPPTPPKPQPQPPPAPSPSCPPIPPKPQPKPPPAPSPGPSPCPPIPPKPQPKPPPAPSPGPSPSPPIPPKPQPKPPPEPKPVPPKPPGPKPVPPPTPSPKPITPKPPSPSPKPAPTPPKPENKTIPAVFFFGDSIFDTGNNNNRDTRIKSNYRPYGMDFPMGVATGRFSNGKVASDYISKYLGVKDIVPAYFDQKLQQSNLQQSDLLTGVSFASGGSGYIPETSKAAKVIPMLDQLNYFQDYKERVKKLVGKKKTKQIVSKGAAIVVAGGNDIMYTYFGRGGESDKKDVDAFTTVMADSAASFVLQLYGYGARRIGVVGTPPLGCTPSQRVKKKKICNEELNYASQLFNSKLLIILGEMSKTLPNSTLVYMDIYSIMSHMIETPSDFGFEEVKKPCCKISKLLGGGIFCKKSTSKICPNTSSYVFWDGVHPTQRAYKTLNKILIKEYIHVLSN